MVPHRLTDIDPESKSAICSVCGPVDIKKRNATSYRCGNKHRETQRPFDWKRNAERGGYAADDYDVNERLRRLESQGGKCAVCTIDITAVSGRLDHNHATGKTRGMLCNTCNIRLAVLEDAAWVAIARAYLLS